MGLTSDSTGRRLAAKEKIRRTKEKTVIALAGNPNVGKSTVFNALTGMKQHTGNWAGKTVASALGKCSFEGKEYILADIPGTYSLMAQSAEEEAARDFLCFENPDAVIVVCDGCCLERNLNLVLQIMEVNRRTIVCVNLIDEMEKKQIEIDFEKLERLLGVPFVGVSAREGRGLENLMRAVAKITEAPVVSPLFPVYERNVEDEILHIEKKLCCEPKRWVAVRLLENDSRLCEKIISEYGLSEEIKTYAESRRKKLQKSNINIGEEIAVRTVSAAQEIAEKTVKYNNEVYCSRDRKIDNILTSRIFGIPVMLGIFGVIFWLTAVGANYPSRILSEFFLELGVFLNDFLIKINCHETIRDMAVNGIYSVLTWVISVMLPPIAIFFPLFTFLEDVGYLPRVAFNLDRFFRRFGACGKQALTMSMGFGCNAAGVTGCRIIDSPRERLIAILTNSFIPCNGRLPSLIAISAMFFTVGMSGLLKSTVSALILLGVILAGVFLSLLVSLILSKTVLKGVPSAFVLELPPYRKPQIGKIIVRSVLDRTVFVLGRACASAAPAGLIIWILANVYIGGDTILFSVSEFLSPLGNILGMDGVILLGFILGFPANEIVFPAIIMGYTASGTLVDADNTAALGTLLAENGWTAVTAVCTLLFMLFHFPCSTTCLTIKKETGSIKWTAAAFFIPLICGMAVCFAVSFISGIFV